MKNAVFPRMQAGQLVLDEINQADAEQVFAIFSDPKVTQNYDVERFTELTQANNLIDYFSERFRSGTGIRWAIRQSVGGNLIGSCGFNTWNQYDHSAVIGYELAQQQWGRGYAREAVKAILNYIFSDEFPFYVNRIEALILPQNAPSIQLATKLKFEFEGLLRGKCYWNQDFHDMGMYSLLRRDWIGNDGTSC